MRNIFWIMAENKDFFDLPCHRVVNRNGELTGKNYFATPTMMREMLIGEGIEFLDDAVNMEIHFWDCNNCILSSLIN
ncbi:MAG: MGMT family protein [Ignavibacteria bacterium]|nr:MGMT family protein [Ignavibacteria bacterium]